MNHEFTYINTKALFWLSSHQSRDVLNVRSKLVQKKYFHGVVLRVQILYTGKCQALGIKQGGPSVGKWAELPIIKSPKIVHYSVGHESQHALLVTEDGATFFVGTPKRGEDGDGSLCELQCVNWHKIHYVEFAELSKVYLLIYLLNITKFVSCVN